MSNASAPRPAGLTAAIVIASVLAAWEGVNALWGVTGAGALAGLQDILARQLPAEVAGEARAQLARVQVALDTAADPRHALALAAILVPVAAWTIGSGIRLHRGKPGSSRSFARAAGALALVVLLQAVHCLYVQWTMRPRLASLLAPSLLPPGAEGERIAGILQQAFEGAILIGVAIYLAVAAGKIVACLYARHRARRSDVLEWTGPPPS